MLDGTVEVVAEANEKQELEDFRNKLNKKAVGGFDDINVERIDGEIKESESAEFSSFDLKF
jgi:acylphosphatase